MKIAQEEMTMKTEKIALVTGASSGIGRAIAIRLAKSHYRVLMTARRLQQLNALRDELLDAGHSVDV